MRDRFPRNFFIIHKNVQSYNKDNIGGNVLEKETKPDIR